VEEYSKARRRGYGWNLMKSSLNTNNCTQSIL